VRSGFWSRQIRFHGGWKLISIGMNGYRSYRWRTFEKNRKVGAAEDGCGFPASLCPGGLGKKRGLYSAKTTYLQEGGRRATTMHARLYDLELQLKDMSEAGIDVSVLSCLLGWNASLDECRLINDDLAKVQEKYLGKFVGLAQAPVLEGEEALQEIERAIRSLSLKGVTITSQIKGVSLDSPKLYGLYEKVCELDVPLFVHPALVPIGYELLQD
jgi:predicted TIM-barrel fold metal-dependent hydrolase